MRSPAMSFQNLVVWRKAHQFVLSVYDLTEKFPGTEIYGLTSQLTRSAVSIAANIAERFRKKGKSDKVRFLNIAQACLEEVSKILDAYSKSILTPDF
jgi:four helix bundle protein